MYKKLVALFGIVMLVIALAPSNVFAATKWKGMQLNDNGDGIHAYLSTGTHSNPANNFAFTAVSPDEEQNWYLQIIPPGQSCVSFIISHLKYAGSGTQYHQMAFQNDCTGGIIWNADLTNASNRSNYIRTFNWNDTGTAYNSDDVEVRIINTSGNCFSGYIYNFNTAVYDLKASACGSTGNSYGGAYFIDTGGTQDAPNAYCPGLAPSQVVHIRGIQYRYGVGNWSNITSGDISTLVNDTMYCFNTTSQYWRVDPAVHAFKFKTAFTAY